MRTAFTVINLMIFLRYTITLVVPIYLSTQNEVRLMFVVMVLSMIAETISSFFHGYFLDRITWRPLLLRIITWGAIAMIPLQAVVIRSPWWIGVTAFFFYLFCSHTISEVNRYRKELSDSSSGLIPKD